MEDKKENKSFKSSYTKGQRVVAGIGVGFLVLLYLVTLVAALTILGNGTGTVPYVYYVNDFPADRVLALYSDFLLLPLTKDAKI